MPKPLSPSMKATSLLPTTETMISNMMLAGVMTFGLSAVAVADNVGKPLPAVELENLTQSPADNFEELAGRAVLIEFFAYW